MTVGTCWPRPVRPSAASEGPGMAGRYAAAEGPVGRNGFRVHAERTVRLEDVISPDAGTVVVVSPGVAVQSVDRIVACRADDRVVRERRPVVAVRACAVPPAAAGECRRGSGTH